MDTSKLKLEKFKNIEFVNFPNEIEIPKVSKNGNIEVIVFFIDKIEDVNTFVKMCNSSKLPKENRTIMIYKKGRKDDVNRDTIFMPFKENIHQGFKLKAPMLCSISDELSACVMCKE